MGHDAHDSHKGHDDHGHGHGHGHGHDDHHAPKFLPYAGQIVPKEVPTTPAMGSAAYYDNSPVFDEEKFANQKPRSNSDRLLSLLNLTVKDSESSSLGIANKAIVKEEGGFFERFFHLLSYPMPRTYTSAYLRPNPCPEVHWWNSWRWPRFRMTNPKVEPPVEGAYNDYYHYLAFKNWFEHERAVYYQTLEIHHEIVLRCLVKEGKYNGFKNCKHLLNKEFAMSREAEHNQMLMYMAVTGNNAIRETPYPEDFVEQKRKIYDNWLFRTRMRKPGDVM